MEENRLHIRSGFLLRDIAGQPVVVAVGKAAEQLHGVIQLNATGAFLWRSLEKGATQSELLTSLLDAYEVEPEPAAADVDHFLKTLRDADLLV